MGCVVNDIIDCDIDKQVERTKTRPLPSGRVILAGALGFLGIESFIYDAMFWPMNPDVSEFCIFVYPCMKRLTSAPQAWLGITVNWGVIVSWLAVNKYMAVIYPLMTGLFAWTVLYDTIYACQDRPDDAKIAVGSLAVLLSNNVLPFLYLYVTTFAFSLALVGYFNGQGILYCAISVFGTALELNQLRSLEPANPSSCEAQLEDIVGSETARVYRDLDNDLAATVWESVEVPRSFKPEIRMYKPLQAPGMLSTAPVEDHILVINAMTPSSDSVAAFNEWYAEEHIPMLSKVPGWIRTRRFEKSWGPGPHYLALHEWASLKSFQTEEFRAATNTHWRTVIMAAVVEKERHVLWFEKQDGET
ncbi:hypothetical protein C8J56DRAFT_1019802 [Mycena floridula]|nr:hypothetical protein C8J56DRAFT_1019802 [Mycena floridula]